VAAAQPETLLANRKPKSSAAKGHSSLGNAALVLIDCLTQTSTADLAIATQRPFGSSFSAKSEIRRRWRYVETR
jgi:hypothetical protein